MILDGSRLTPPEELVTLLHAWQAKGRPPQPGIRWPRDRWIEAFPEYSALLSSLPPTLDRLTVRAVCAEAASTPEAAARSFLTVFAWGYGAVGYGRWRAREALTAPSAGEHLRQAVESLHEGGPLAGYEMLASHRLPKFGPAFGTKFLAFCSRDAARPPLILDRLVAQWLDRTIGLSLNPIPWNPRTYRRYMDLVYGWAAELKAPPEDLELCIFTAESRREGNQWAN